VVNFEALATEQTGSVANASGSLERDEPEALALKVYHISGLTGIE